MFTDPLSEIHSMEIPIQYINEQANRPHWDDLVKFKKKSQENESLLKKADIYMERNVTGVKPRLTKRSCRRMVRT